LKKQFGLRQSISGGRHEAAPWKIGESIMPEITNSTLKAELGRICPILRKRGDNLTAEHIATVIVRTVLGEMGCKAEMGDEFKKERAELVSIIKPLITASKNYQNSYCSKTAGADGEKLMPEVKAGAESASGEFA
jgi:hypothetical protein